MRLCQVSLFVKRYVYLSHTSDDEGGSVYMNWPLGVNTRSATKSVNRNVYQASSAWPIAKCKQWLHVKQHYLEIILKLIKNYF